MFCSERTITYRQTHEERDRYTDSHEASSNCLHNKPMTSKTLTRDFRLILHADVSILCGRLNKPQYGSCPSVRPSVCLSVLPTIRLSVRYVLLIENKKRRKAKIWVNVSRTEAQ